MLYNSHHGDSKFLVLSILINKKLKFGNFAIILFSSENILSNNFKRGKRTTLSKKEEKITNDHQNLS